MNRRTIENPFLLILAAGLLSISIAAAAGHADSNVWLQVPSGTTEILSDVWGSNGDFFIVGSAGTILRREHGLWSPMESGTAEDLQGVWGSSSRDVYAVGVDGLVLRFNGIIWTPVPVPTVEFLRGVWGTAPDDVFITGTRGTILHYDGIRWDAMESNTPNRLYGVWGASSDDVFVAGHLATILRYDGAVWSVMESGVRPTLTGVWGSSGYDVFVGGASGVIVHYDGVEWTPQHSGTEEDLNRVWGDGAGTVYAVGTGGTILRHEGAQWTSMSTPTSQSLKSVFGTAERVFAVGFDGVILTLAPSVPVFFEVFDAALANGVVLLHWRTTSNERVVETAVRRVDLLTGLEKTRRFGAGTQSAEDAGLESGRSYRYSADAVLDDGTRITSSPVDVRTPAIATRIANVHPNPFNPTVSLIYRVGKPGPIRVSIHDVRGRLVATPVDEPTHPAGLFTIEWDGSLGAGGRASSGVYFLRLVSDDGADQRRIVLVK